MTNGELFIVENPNIEFRLNGSCVWIYFDGVNHYTMPISWWEQEISLFDNIKAEIEPTRKMYLDMNDIDWLNGCDYVLSVIDKYKAKESENV